MVPVFGETKKRIMTEKKHRKIVVSGIRPTGNLHLGNYFGAVRSFVKMQSEYQCYFSLPTYIR